MTATRARGRPKKLDSADLLLDAGCVLLLSHGARVTVDAIAAKAGVAKTTFYTYFRDKETFIEAVMLRESARTISDSEFAAAEKAPLHDVLQAFGERYLRFANENRLLQWDRLIASANDIYPELARRLYDAGPGRGYTLLTYIIRRAAMQGLLTVDDPASAAGDLAALWYGVRVLQVNLRVAAPMDEAEISARAKRGVSLFLQLYAAPKKEAGCY